MILAAVPGARVRGPAWPAPISPTTGSSTGCSALAVATSACRTAYPSIAELSKLGSDMVATTSSAHTSPSASRRGTSTGASARTPESTRSRCSSTEQGRPSVMGTGHEPESSVRTVSAGMRSAPSVVSSTSPTTWTWAPKVKSPSTVRRVAFFIEGVPSGKRLSNSATTL